MEVVAEDVETPAQASVVTELGCDLLQGVLIARPMPADEVPRWLQTPHGAPASAASVVDAALA